MTVATVPPQEREEFEAAARASLLWLRPDARERLGQELYREAERRGLVMRLGFDELSGAARLGELGVLSSMIGAIHHVAPSVLDDVCASGDEAGCGLDAAACAALSEIAAGDAA